jgi:hypothetical protein
MAQPRVEITLPVAEARMSNVATELSHDLGVSVHLGLHDDRRTFDDLPGYVILTAALSAFFQSMLAAWGAGAATRLSRALDRLRHGDRADDDSSEGTTIRLVEPTQRVTIVFDDEAARDPRAVPRILELQFETLLPRTVLRWNPGHGDWRADGRSEP